MRAVAGSTNARQPFFKAAPLNGQPRTILYGRRKDSYEEISGYRGFETLPALAAFSGIFREIMSRTGYREVVDRAGILVALREFDPHIAGSPPLNLDVPTSDIDILCYAPDPCRFTSAVWKSFGSHRNFRMWQWQGTDRPVLATFEAYNWHFEIFGQARPVPEQAGWRHFVIEQRLLDLGGRSLASAVMAFRRNGLKTEPAFAAALKLAGDPYQTLLNMDDWTDDALLMLIGRAMDE